MPEEKDYYAKVIETMESNAAMVKLAAESVDAATKSMVEIAKSFKRIEAILVKTSTDKAPEGTTRDD